MTNNGLKGLNNEVERKTILFAYNESIVHLSIFCFRAELRQIYVFIMLTK